MSAAQPGQGPSTEDSIFIDPYEPEYPSDDGNPMAESTLQYQWIVTIKEGIEVLFEDRDDVFVAGDLLWYATKRDKNDVVAPDVLVVFGRPKGHRRSYREWVEDGVAPQVVFEIDSPSNTATEMERKLAIYDRRGVEEYYYYDPESGKLEGWFREAGALVPILDFQAWRSPRLGITFKAPRRKDALIVRRPDGKRFRSFVEIHRLAEEEGRRRRRAERQARERAEQAQTQRRLREIADLRAETARERADVADLRAQAERERAETERGLREQAEIRARRMEAMLRAMGVDPE